jgi:hypothetical protein
VVIGGTLAITEPTFCKLEPIATNIACPVITMLCPSESTYG